jgi:carboxylesterase type B
VLITDTSVSHGSEVNYVYGIPDDQSASSLRISELMIDYWVSFATSLDPNDGKGLQRTFPPPSTSSLQVRR